MNIFVAGIHGVGKTYLAAQLPDRIGLMHTSASKLIREELTMPSWGTDKRVSDIDANQIALAAAVKRYNDAGTRLLLDGHFVLLNTQGEFSCLGTEVFRSLNLCGVVLIEADPYTVGARVRERDGQELSVEQMQEFIVTERMQAQLVCEELGIPLRILDAPSLDAFVQAVALLAS